MFAANIINRLFSSLRINEDYSLTAKSLDVPTSCKSVVQKPISVPLVKNDLYIVSAAEFDAKNKNIPALRSSVRYCHYLSADGLCVTRPNIGDQRFKGCMGRFLATVLLMKYQDMVVL